VSHPRGGYGPPPGDGLPPDSSMPGARALPPGSVPAPRPPEEYYAGPRPFGGGRADRGAGYPHPGHGAYGRGYGTGYGSGWGTASGPRPIPRPLPPPPEHRGTGLRGVFTVLAIVAVVLGGTIGLRQGFQSLSLLSSGSSSYSAGGGTPAEPVSAQPVAGPLTREDAVALQGSVGPALVNITAQLTSQHAIGAGTGIVLSNDGEILTNNHVIRGASSIKVYDIGNGRSYPATVVGYDTQHDIAVLQARGASGLRTARIGDSDSVQVGDQVAAIGNAGGRGGKPSVATGPVTALDRSIKTSDELTGATERLSGLIEANADIQPGDSGGPMVNSEGEVVGVDVAASIDSRSQAPDGTGFAIPINDALSVAREIRGGAATQAVHIGETGLLGVTVSGLSDRSVRDAMAEFGRSDSVPATTGAFVSGVMFDSPAGQVGLEPGDVITQVDGTPIDSASTLTTLVGTHRPGDKLAVRWVESSGRSASATVALVAGPPS
jgi:S1-C subfamily serine protease